MDRKRPGFAGNGPNAELAARLLRLEEIVLKNTESRISIHAPPVHRPWQTSALTTFVPPTNEGLPSKIEADILKSVSFNEDWFTSISPLNICFRICSMKHIPQSPTYLWPSPRRSASFQEPVRCIWLPLREEARRLFDKYVRDVTFIHHVIHTPTVRFLIDDIYDKLAQDQPVSPGQVALLMSIFGSASYAWTFHDMNKSMYDTVEGAHSQSTMWVRACLDLLDHCRRSSVRSFEALQGIVIAFFMLVNLEGMTVRYTSMVGQAICMAREIGLHRLDHPNYATSDHAPRAGTVTEEIGRRIWWYLCATDWMLSRYAGPQEGSYSIHLCHMATRKPWNVNDEDLYDGMKNIDRPLSEPTEMSYFLQRIRLGEMCRELVDRMPLGITASDRSGYADVIAVDAQFLKFLGEIPEFFTLEAAEQPAELQKPLATGIIVQRYIIHSLVHSHRCKLHLPYLAKVSSNTQYSYSREACLEAARQTVRTEKLLERESVQFVHARFRISGVLQAIYIASIAFLLDMCFHNVRGQCDPERKVELLEACYILEEAVSHSPFTANLLESLDSIVQKYRLSLPRLSNMPRASPPQNPQNQVAFDTTGRSQWSAGLDSENLANKSVEPAAQGDNPVMDPSSWDTFNAMNVDNLDWDSLLSELDSQFLVTAFPSI
ncbi:conserved hypothetical protein [Talaromyces stipitatus ATCC 10500]|uniref:Xylanolytic transcriptional activator regulatory domain-containing protein n=1 Tax=Talaromyces stipitatus (strain ATCC 10500 / CBS 375.48 / QM 6759 / NRRL 1006) TaxID=441959 RepID=B8MJV8_TALSN|nr:uncharacterized protein TSTA_042490 [Talaromyces stipitatus ATCC 10500]EED14775.1 conserved hypothetical protein [Talaromyces stipitatus ATCC 10500]